MTAYQKDDPQTIQSMFNSIASRYDMTNTVLSMRMHKKWNKILVRNVMLSHTPHTLLDLCCGTGDIALEYLNRVTMPCQAYLVDFCHNMLACAQVKGCIKSIQRHQVQYIEADVQELPLPIHSIDCATMAYGIRNVKDPKKCLQEAYRVLKPGGRLGVLELTRPKNRLLRLGHEMYLRTALPFFGKWLTSNQEAYQYLCNSIYTFIDPDKLESLFMQAGFNHTYRQPLAGGIATIIIGHKEGHLNAF